MNVSGRMNIFSPPSLSKLFTQFLYAKAMRSKVAESNPDASFGDITKIVAKDFKNLSPEERAVWDDRAAKDKVRFTEAMANYSGPEDESDDGGGKKKKRAKDPNAPKRPMSSYMFFSTKNRERVKKENPGITMGEIVSFLQLIMDN